MKRRLAWFMLAVSVVGWPLSMLTFAKDEPPAILALSWMALVFSAIDAIFIEEKD